MKFERIGVLGAGGWGTALAVLLVERGYSPVLWGFEADQVEKMQKERCNPLYLPGVELPEQIRVTAMLKDLSECELILFVTPSMGVNAVAERFAAIGPSVETVFLTCTKGIEQGSGRRMSEILQSFFPQNPVAVLSGPSHAEEVSRKMPTAVVIGAEKGETAEDLQQTISTTAFRTYTSDDVIGIELGGALKNVFALAAGISDGLGLGDNSKAALMTRSLAELVRLGTALGGKRETFHGLSGIGDLMVTCFSRHSRNRLVGERLGKGDSLEEIAASMKMVAEGVPTAKSALECARRQGVRVPITEQVNAILYEGRAPREALTELLHRELRPETDVKRL